LPLVTKREWLSLMCTLALSITTVSPRRLILNSYWACSTWFKEHSICVKREVALLFALCPFNVETVSTKDYDSKTMTRRPETNEVRERDYCGAI
jgi:hypothetical protein